MGERAISPLSALQWVAKCIRLTELIRSSTACFVAFSPTRGGTPIIVRPSPLPFLHLAMTAANQPWDCLLPRHQCRCDYPLTILNDLECCQRRNDTDPMSLRQVFDPLLFTESSKRNLVQTAVRDDYDFRLLKQIINGGNKHFVTQR